MSIIPPASQLSGRSKDKQTNQKTKTNRAFEKFNSSPKLLSVQKGCLIAKLKLLPLSHTFLTLLLLTWPPECFQASSYLRSLYLHFLLPSILFSAAIYTHFLVSSTSPSHFFREDIPEFSTQNSSFSGSLLISVSCLCLITTCIATDKCVTLCNSSSAQLFPKILEFKTFVA